MKQFNILIVEDDQSTRDTFCQLLESSGFRVVAVEGYEQALARIDASIDLALLDIRLNGKSGIDLLRYLRHEQPEIPVVMISAYADKENVLESLQLGAVDYLEKPIQPKKLIEAIENWVGLRLNHNLKDWHEVFQQLRESELNIHKAYERLNFVLVSTAAVIYAADPSEQCHINFISSNVRKMCGHEAGAFTGDPEFWQSCIHPDDRGHVEAEWKKALARGENHCEYRFRHSDGHYLWISDHIKLEKNRDGKSELLGFWVDITKRKQSEDQVRQMAYFDPLTGLPNRSLFYDRIKQAIAQSSRNRTAMAVLFMDLD